MNIEEIEIAKLIPQRKPMIMIDKLLSFSEKEVRTSFKINKKNIFVKNGVLQEVALIENIAQTAAAGTGYNAFSENKTPQKGFIGAVKKFEVHSLPKVDDVVETKLIITAEVLNASIVEGEVYCNSELIAKAELKIFLLED